MMVFCTIICSLVVVAVGIYGFIYLFYKSGDWR